MQRISNKKAVILRGLPGSGKSTYLTSLLSGLDKSAYRVHSTDQYFFKNGQYSFDTALLEKHHCLNKLAFLKSLQEGVSLVICDNTNIEAWQYEPYIQQASGAGYDVELVSIGLFKNEAAHVKYQARNSHGVALSVIQNMAKKS